MMQLSRKKPKQQRYQYYFQFNTEAKIKTNNKYINAVTKVLCLFFNLFSELYFKWKYRILLQPHRKFRFTKSYLHPRYTWLTKSRPRKNCYWCPLQFCLVSLTNLANLVWIDGNASGINVNASPISKEQIKTNSLS